MKIMSVRMPLPGLLLMVPLILLACSLTASEEATAVPVVAPTEEEAVDPATATSEPEPTAEPTAMPEEPTATTEPSPTPEVASGPAGLPPGVPQLTNAASANAPNTTVRPRPFIWRAG